MVIVLISQLSPSDPFNVLYCYKLIFGYIVTFYAVSFHLTTIYILFSCGSFSSKTFCLILFLISEL